MNPNAPKQLVLGLLASLALLLGASGTAGAATTIGSPLTATPNTVALCNGEVLCTYVQAALPGATLIAPASGVVVRWRIKTSGAAGPFSLRIVRAAGAGTFTGVSTSSAQTTLGAGISTFNTRQKILGGDQLALNQPNSPGAAYANNGATGAEIYYRTPDLADGATHAHLGPYTDYEWLINADIEADADLDGYGDETQDACPGDTAAFALPCIPPDSTPPVMTATFSKRQRVALLSYSVSTNEAAALEARATVSLGSGTSKTVRSKLIKLSVVAGVKTKLKPRFSKTTLARIKRSLKSGRKLKAKISISAKDAVGNTRFETVKVSLRL